MQSLYSVYGTKLHFILDDEFATNYNRAQDALFVAQRMYQETTGQQWTGVEQIVVDWTNEEMSAFNKFAELMNKLIEVNGGSLDMREEDMLSDYLVKL